MRKYRAFWPLPGGEEKFVDTLQRCLRFIKRNKPSRVELDKWFRRNFRKVTRPGATRGYITSALWHSGLVEHDKTIHFLTEDGEGYLTNPDNVLLFEILDEHVAGFREALEIISKREPNKEELGKELPKQLGLNWKSADNQPLYRIQWLKSMGFVLEKDGRSKLTKAGQELVERLTSGRLPLIMLFRLSRRLEFPEGINDVRNRLREKMVEKRPEYWFRRNKPQDLPKGSKIVFSIGNRAVGETNTASEIQPTKGITYRYKVRLASDSIRLYDPHPIIPKDIRGRTFKKLTTKEYYRIVDQLGRSIKQDAQKQRSATQASIKYRAREKSREHKMLEDLLIHHPEKIERGLRFEQKEYRYPTGDRVDLVFVDRTGGFVTVEIEPTVEEGDRTGLLQAIKYRYMLSACEDIDLSKIRTFLVATRIHRSVRRLCRKHMVNAVGIPVSR